MLVISRQQIERLIARLDEPDKLGECRREVASMLEIESALLGKANDMLLPCCGSLEPFKGGLASEVSILREALNALAEGDVPKAQRLLGEFKSVFAQMPR